MKKENAVNYKQELRNLYNHWNIMKEQGGNDPNWEDGYNMNLTRNHIIYCKQKCEEDLKPEEYPEEFYYELPEEVDNKYMARADEIRKHAKEALVTYKKNEDFLYLQKIRNTLTKDQIKKSLIENVLNYCYGLEIYIKKDNLLRMRLHEYPERYLDAFTNCRERIETMTRIKYKEKILPEGQLSIFDIWKVK